MDPDLQGASPGSNIVLVCEYSSSSESNLVDNAVYSWMREDGSSLQGEQFEISGDSGEILRINNAQVSDSGVYVCTVRTISDGQLTGSGEVIIGE